jgi:hypothetical protein
MELESFDLQGASSTDCCCNHHACAKFIGFRNVHRHAHWHVVKVSAVIIGFKLELAYALAVSHAIESEELNIRLLIILIIGISVLDESEAHVADC